MQSFILASGSPRRRELLEAAGYSFTVKASSVAEPSPEGFVAPDAYVAHVAWLKATAVGRTEVDQWVLAADTMAVIGPHVLGKPVDRADADRILSLLQGSRHHVWTGVALYYPRFDVSLVAAVETTVVMKPLSRQELEAYLDTGLWEGKAGAFGIQDHDDPFVSAVEGSYTNVVGLPMERLADLFQIADRIGAS